MISSTGGTLTLQNSDTTISANDVLGKIEFQAPNEATGGTSRDVLGAIEFNATSDITSNTKAFTEFTIKGSNSSNINQELVTINGDGSIAMKGDLSHSGSSAFSIGNVNGNLNLVSSSNQAKLQGNDVLLNSSTSIAMNAQSGDITIDAQGADTDIIFKGTDNTTDITALTLDMSDAGTAIFNHDVKLGNDSKLILGASGGTDLQIYHDEDVSGNNIIESGSGSGNLQIKADGFYFNYQGGVGNVIRADTAGAVSLSYRGNTGTKDERVITTGYGTDFKGTLGNIDATMNKYGSTTAPIIFTVTVATQTAAHPYNGDGSTNKYVINGVQGAALTLHGADNVTSSSQYIYRFDQSDSSNISHPLRFYLDAAKTTAYTTGVTTSGTPGYGTAYTQIAVTQDTPQILYYQCQQHGYMGNYVIIPHSTNIKQRNGNISLNAVGGNIQLNGDTGNSVKVTGDLETTGSIQLGNSSDTTLSRSAAGTAQIEGNTILTLGNSDAPTTITSSSGVNVLVDDGGTMKKITPANLGVGSGGGGGSTAADDITAGNAAVNLTTSSGNITIDAQGSDTDIIFKGTDNTTDITFLTMDGSASAATFGTTVVFDPAGGSSQFAAQINDNTVFFYRDVKIVNSNSDLIFDKGTYETTLTTTNPASQNQTITLPDATGTVLTTGNSDTPTTITSSSGVNVLVDDGGTMKKITPANLGIGGGGGGSNQNAFSKFSVAGQTSVEADAVQDEVTLVGAGGINITTNASNDTITFTGGGAGISEEQAIAFAIVYG